MKPKQNPGLSNSDEYLKSVVDGLRRKQIVADHDRRMKRSPNTSPNTTPDHFQNAGAEVGAPHTKIASDTGVDISMSNQSHTNGVELIFKREDIERLNNQSRSNNDGNSTAPRGMYKVDNYVPEPKIRSVKQLFKACVCKRQSDQESEERDLLTAEYSSCSGSDDNMTWDAATLGVSNVRGGRISPTVVSKDQRNRAAHRGYEVEVGRTTNRPSPETSSPIRSDSSTASTDVVVDRNEREALAAARAAARVLRIRQNYKQVCKKALQHMEGEKIKDSRGQKEQVSLTGPLGLFCQDSGLTSQGKGQMKKLNGTCGVHSFVCI